MSKRSTHEETSMGEVAKPKRRPDPEFAVIRRIQRALMILGTDAQRRRVITYVAARSAESNGEAPAVTV